MYLCVQDKTIEAMMVARETFPDKWAEDERRRLERHTMRVEEALKCVLEGGRGCVGERRAPKLHPKAISSASVTIIDCSHTGRSA